MEKRGFNTTPLKELSAMGYKVTKSGWINPIKSPENKSSRSHNKFKSKYKAIIKSISPSSSKLPNTRNASEKKRDHKKIIVDVEPRENIKDEVVLVDDDDSFDETFNKILKNIERTKAEGIALDKFDQLNLELDKSESKYSQKENLHSNSTPDIPLLDCKHLSQIELETCFHEQLDYITDILNETIHHERHELYKNHKLKSRLIYNTSTIMFDDNQRHYLIKLLEEKLDPTYERTEYCFMVLLPELCLRIFMTTQDMNREEAVDYLEKRPID